MDSSCQLAGLLPAPLKLKIPFGVGSSSVDPLGRGCAGMQEMAAKSCSRANPPSEAASLQEAGRAPQTTLLLTPQQANSGSTCRPTRTTTDIHLPPRAAAFKLLPWQGPCTACSGRKRFLL